MRMPKQSWFKNVAGLSAAKLIWTVPQKGLRCRISPTCTLSQNGYGAHRPASLISSRCLVPSPLGRRFQLRNPRAPHVAIRNRRRACSELAHWARPSHMRTTSVIRLAETFQVLCLIYFCPYVENVVLLYSCHPHAIEFKQSYFHLQKAWEYSKAMHHCTCLCKSSSK